MAHYPWAQRNNTPTQDEYKQMRVLVEATAPWINPGPRTAFPTNIPNLSSLTPCERTIYLYGHFRGYGEGHYHGIIYFRFRRTEESLGLGLMRRMRLFNPELLNPQIELVELRREYDALEVMYQRLREERRVEREERMSEREGMRVERGNIARGLRALLQRGEEERRRAFLLGMGVGLGTAGILVACWGVIVWWWFGL